MRRGRIFALSTTLLFHVPLEAIAATSAVKPAKDTPSHAAASRTATSPAAKVAGDGAKPSGAAGRPDGATPAPMLDENIVVSARKRAERSIDTPLAITTLNAQDLISRNLVQMKDYFHEVPGLSLNMGSGGQTNIAIRGVTTSSNSVPTVGITIDDIPFGSSSGTGYGALTVPDLDPADLARIEVLRGPQGTLYGSSSLGGLIKYETSDPSLTRASARIQTDFLAVPDGSYGGGGRMQVTTPLVKDKLALSISGFVRGDPGYVSDRALGAHNLNKSSVKGGRVSLLWKPVSWFSAKLGALGEVNDGWGDGTVDTNYRMEPTSGALNQTRLPGTGAYKLANQLYSATLRADLGMMDLTSLTGYGIHRYEANMDYSPSLGGYAAALYGVPGATLNNAFETRKFSQELRLSSHTHGPIEWMVGGFYTYEWTDAQQIVDATDPLDGRNTGFLLNSSFPSRYREAALFGDLTYRITRNFDIQVGGRYAHNHQSYHELDTGPLGGDYTVSSVSKGSPGTFLVTPRYHITPDLMTYIRIASGYRAGGPNPGSFAGFPSQYGADRTYNYEIGLKGTVLNRKLTFESDLFWIDWNKIQLLGTDPTTGFQYYTNAGKARSAGAEASFTMRPIDNLVIRGTFAYTDAVLQSTLPSGTYGNPGDRLPFTGRFTASLDIRRDYRITPTLWGYADVNWSYTGSRLAGFVARQDYQRATFPAFNLVGVRSGIRRGRWDAQIYIDNIANERGILGGGSRSAAAGINNPFFAYYVRPRTVGLSVSTSF